MAVRYYNTYRTAIYSLISLPLIYCVSKCTAPTCLPGCCVSGRYGGFICDRTQDCRLPRDSICSTDQQCQSACCRNSCQDPSVCISLTENIFFAVALYFFVSACGVSLFYCIKSCYDKIRNHGVAPPQRVGITRGVECAIPVTTLNMNDSNLQLNTSVSQSRLHLMANNTSASSLISVLPVVIGLPKLTDTEENSEREEVSDSGRTSSRRRRRMVRSASATSLREMEEEMSKTKPLKIDENAIIDVASHNNSFDDALSAMRGDMSTEQRLRGGGDGSKEGDHQGITEMRKFYIPTLGNDEPDHPSYWNEVVTRNFDRFDDEEKETQNRDYLNDENDHDRSSDEPEKDRHDEEKNISTMRVEDDNDFSAERSEVFEPPGYANT